MAGEQIPEAWVGKQVMLTYWNGNTDSAIRCTLEVVNDRGIVVAAQENEYQPAHTSFYPWSSVLHIQKV